MSQETVKNAVQSTMDAIKANPSTGNVVFRAATQWVEDVRCTGTVRGFTPLNVDEPPELGGDDSAANPTELVLVALGTCQGIMYAAYAAMMGIELDSVKVNVKGYLDLQGLLGLDEDVPPGYKRIAFETELESPASDEELKQLIETVEDHCPVLDILCRAQKVSGTAKANGRKLTSMSANAA